MSSSSSSNAESRFQTLERLYHEARELPAGERAAFLDSRCGADSALRAELDELLAEAEDLEDFMEPVVEASTDGGLIPAEHAPLPTISGYRIEEEIASGGMGTVYRAQRSDGHFDQTAAIKVIRQGLHRRDLLERFKQERQTLAQLNHPNIGRLLDGGATLDGQPFLVMEFIDGVPIDEFCRENALSIAGRLELFRDVCSAVQYAHRQLVIHRDLKPTNVIVDGDGTPKLVDFGIAKVLEPGRDSEGLTETGGRVMTRDYASPEQIRGEPVTTASDVYSLGVLLYKLLTTRAPYRLDSDLPHEVERAICEAEPEKPSTAVSRADTPTDGRPLAEVNPQRLRRKFEGDLDTILLTALEKDPDRRYASVDRFSEDIRRFLEGLPIQARRPTPWYRISKFLVRNRVFVVMALAVFSSLTFALVYSMKSAESARIESAIADSERQRADTQAETSRRVKALLGKLMASASPYDTGRDLRVQDILADAAGWLAHELDGQPEVEVEVRETIGATYIKLGMLEEARVHLNRVLELQRELGNEDDLGMGLALARMGHLEVLEGRLDEGRESLHRALAILRQHRDRQPGRLAATLRVLSMSHRLRFEFEEALAFLEEGLEVCLEAGPRCDLERAEALDRLAFTYYMAREPARGLPFAQEAIELGQQLFNPQHHTLAHFRSTLASVMRASGEGGEARALAESTLAQRRQQLAEDHPLILEGLNSLGAFHLADKDGAAARVTFEESLAILRRSFHKKHPGLLYTLNQLGVACRMEDDLVRAREVYVESLALAEELHGLEHETVGYVCHNLGVLNSIEGRLKEAEAFLRRALAIKRVEFGAAHSDTLITLDAIDVLVNRLQSSGAVRKAANLLELLIEVKRPYGSDEEMTGWWFMLSALHGRSEEWEAGVDAAREALALLLEADPAPLDRVAMVRSLLGHLLTQQGEHAAAEEELDVALEGFLALYGENHGRVHGCRARLATLYERTGRGEEAAAIRGRLPKK